MTTVEFKPSEMSKDATVLACGVERMTLEEEKKQRKDMSAVTLWKWHRRDTAH